MVWKEDTFWIGTRGGGPGRFQWTVSKVMLDEEIIINKKAYVLDDKILFISQANDTGSKSQKFTSP